MKSNDILLIEDEADIRAVMAGILGDEGYSVREAATSQEALEIIRQRLPSLVVLDVWLAGSEMDGLELLEVLKVEYPDLPVVIVSGHGTVETAVSAIRKGAYDYIVKPFKAAKLLVTTQRALEAARLRKENKRLRGRADDDDVIVGQSAIIQHLRTKVERIAPTNSRVMITGPSGSGKELIARNIHAQSSRADGPFEAVNAASMVPERVEEELFGMEAGQGRLAKIGLLEKAHLGTLYLDEVGDMPRETQSKLLRLLVEQRFRRLGGDSDVQVDVRIVSSSSRDMEAEIESGKFRKDLFHRLNVVPLKVPSLSERRDDIPDLVAHFIETLTRTTGLPNRAVAPDAVAALQAHDWPGNVRQLRNNVERLLILAKGSADEPISLANLPEEVAVGRKRPDETGRSERIVGMNLRDAREHFERSYLLEQIERFSGNISRTAEFVGMERSALHRKLKSLGISPSQRSSDNAKS